ASTVPGLWYSCYPAGRGQGNPYPVREQAGIPCGDPPPALDGFPFGPQPFVLLADPAHQVGIDARQELTQRRAVECPIISHPSANNRVDAPCEFREGGAG